jgi:hypothetical protein
MTKLLKKGHHVVIAQLCPLDVLTSISSTPVDLQIVINNHSKVFGEIPKGIPPTQYHNHVIHCNQEVYHLTLGLASIHVHRRVALSI